MRFAIWTAVSTAEQARPEKYSLETQLERCRTAGQSFGWVETAAYTVSGQSRTKHIQLDQAAAEIEPLRLMLADARAGQFDLPTYTERRATLTAQIAAEQNTQNQNAALETQRRAITAKLTQLQTLDLSHWLTTTAPGLVNQTLHTILTSITVGESVSVEFR